MVLMIIKNEMKMKIGLKSAIAGKLCERFRLSTFIKPQTPRVNNKFSLEEVNEKFVCDELKRLKSKKATGLDRMTARLLKDAAPVIAKPITYIINLTISTSEIPPACNGACNPSTACEIS